MKLVGIGKEVLCIVNELEKVNPVVLFHIRSKASDKV